MTTEEEARAGGRLRASALPASSAVPHGADGVALVVLLLRGDLTPPAEGPGTAGNMADRGGRPDSDIPAHEEVCLVHLVVVDALQLAYVRQPPVVVLGQSLWWNWIGKEGASGDNGRLIRNLLKGKKRR